DSIILPNISPTKGIKTGSLNLILNKIFMNTNVPASANKKETIILVIEPAFEKSMRDTKIQNRAESIVPAVVGDTNLLLLNCCIIKPIILILAPALRMITILGHLLINSTFH